LSQEFENKSKASLVPQTIMNFNVLFPEIQKKAQAETILK